MTSAVIDAHNHLSRFPNHVRGLSSGDDAADDRALGDLQAGWIRSMEENGVSRSVIFDSDNAAVADFVAEAPDRFSALAVIDPRGGQTAIAEARRWLDSGFLGVKCSPSAEGSRDGLGYDLDDPESDPFFGYCAENGVPILFHTGVIYIKAGHPASHDVSQALPLRLDRIARRHPDLRIVMGHVGRPFWGQALALSNHPNVYVDLTWSQLPVHFYRHSVETALFGFGAERTMFGSDSTPGMPDRSVELLARTRELLDEFGASRAETAEVLGGTAARLFSIPAASAADAATGGETP